MRVLVHTTSLQLVPQDHSGYPPAHHLYRVKHGIMQTHNHVTPPYPTPAHMHARMHAHAHTCAHTRTHTRAHAHTHACTCTHMRTYTYTHARARTHTHTHTHTLSYKESALALTGFKVQDGVQGLSIVRYLLIQSCQVELILYIVLIHLDTVNTHHILNYEPFQSKMCAHTHFPLTCPTWDSGNIVSREHKIITS